MTLKDKILKIFGIPLGLKILDLVFSTASIKVLDPEKVLLPFLFGYGGIKPQPCVFVFWHGKLAPIIYCFRGSNAYGLVSKSKDGELLYSTFKRLGLDAVRGSSSRAQISSAISLVRLLQEGHHVALAPDGPKGPRWKAQTGAVAIAKLAGVPIVPVGCGIKRKIVFNSWDRFELPLFFSSIVFTTGKSIRVESEDLEKSRGELEEELIRITALAEKIAQTGGYENFMP